MATEAEDSATKTTGEAKGAAADSPGDEALAREITERLEAFCAERGYVLSDMKDELVRDLVEMRKKYGDYYCPCQVGNDPDTVCVCTAVKQGLVDVEGACFCYLVIQPDQAPPPADK